MVILAEVPERLTPLRDGLRLQGWSFVVGISASENMTKQHAGNQVSGIRGSRRSRSSSFYLTRIS